MIEMSSTVKLPSTRYQGSKEKIVKWIWGQVLSLNLEFESVLDAFGGTGVVGYYAKIMGKSVTFNDILRSNYYIGKAIIENDNVRLNKDDLEFLLTKHEEIDYPTFIQDTYRNVYYTDEENAWLDMIVRNIRELKNEYKIALAMSALFQACLVKRPYNLFHRANLYMRFADVKRSFGNKKTWDTPFPNHFVKFVEELNSCVFSNGKKNKALNMDVFEIDGDYDLVYLDPPYFSKKRGATDYYLYYHFLEGLCIYLEKGEDCWRRLIDFSRKPKPLKHGTKIEYAMMPWLKKSMIIKAFDRLFKKFSDSIIVLSYNSDGVPSESEIVRMLKKYKKNVVVRRIQHQYALSNSTVHELLFIAF
jgi:adenine-specific DNA methylase